MMGNTPSRVDPEDPEDGTVRRMEADFHLIKQIQGGGTKIFDVDLSKAEILVSLK